LIIVPKSAPSRADEPSSWAASTTRWPPSPRLQGRREQGERHAHRIFELSDDLLCIAGFDGYFKRVNPAFERLLGYPAETLLSRPTQEFVHPDDRSARAERHAPDSKAETTSWGSSCDSCAATTRSVGSSGARGPCRNNG
jgi:PAS domain-containing protein